MYEILYIIIFHKSINIYQIQKDYINYFRNRLGLVVIKYIIKKQVLPRITLLCLF